MRIKIMRSVPVEARHGIEVGKTYDVVEVGPGHPSQKEKVQRDRGAVWWFVQGDGELVGVLWREAEEVTDEEAPA